MPSANPIVIRFEPEPVLRQSTPIGADTDDRAAALRPAVMLDRDGVLNVDHGYVSSPAEWEWVQGAREAVALLNSRCIPVVVVTNQSGIGRGYSDEATYLSLMAWVQSELATFGARLDAAYACPHHPTEAKAPYLLECACRKPHPGMLLSAIRDLRLDPDRSFMIGDSQRDLDAATAAGITPLLFDGGSLEEFVRQRIVTEPPTS